MVIVVQIYTKNHWTLHFTWVNYIWIVSQWSCFFNKEYTPFYLTGQSTSLTSIAGESRGSLLMYPSLSALLNAGKFLNSCCYPTPFPWITCLYNQLQLGIYNWMPSSYLRFKCTGRTLWSTRPRYAPPSFPFLLSVQSTLQVALLFFSHPISK